MSYKPPQKIPFYDKQSILAVIDKLGESYPPQYKSVLKGIVEQESNFKNIQGKINSADHGIFQINAKAHADPIKKGQLDPYDLTSAASYAFKLLDDNVKKTGSLEAAILAYNAGAGRVKQFLEGKKGLEASIQTKYAPEVMARANKYSPGIFSMQRINEAAQKFGYNGKADFVALSGGKANLTNAFQLQEEKPMANPTMDGFKPSDVASNTASQAVQSIMPDVQTASMEQDNSELYAPDEDMFASIKPSEQVYDTSYESKLKEAFGFAAESPLDKMGLPKGLMIDIRKAVENA